VYFSAALLPIGYDETVLEMEPLPQPAPGYYVWSPPDSPVIVHLHLDVIDRLSAEVMRGFGAVPKRGAEIGGVLIGVVEPGTTTIVRIEDFEAVPCEYKRGPSFLFTDEEAPIFESTVQRWERDGSRPNYAVGFFRSDTREGMRLATEDTELLEACFPSASAVALLIKPYATKVSMAGFFVREYGSFPPETKLEFPFRRRELTGEEPPPRRSLYERRSRSRAGAAVTEMTHTPQAPEQPTLFAEPEPHETEPAYVTTSKARKRTWVWIPLSFIFLLVGVVLGFQAALMLYPQMSANNSADLTLDLEASRNGESVTVRWNREAPAVKNAQKGELHINDGGASLPQPVVLGRADLQTGSVIYQNASPNVEFRLVIFLNDRLTLAETLNWKQ
jgi:hypothetical protein